MLLDFDDILIEPSIISNIRSRSKIDPYDHMRMLPLITAPMDTVISSENCGIFKELGIYSIIPRKPSYTNDDVSYDPMIWMAYGLEDFKGLFIDKIFNNTGKFYVLIDIANGHMKDLIDSVATAKTIYGDDMVLMAGNCAHPLTYLAMAQAGADYVRMGIGNGGGCLTTVQTGVGYPMASLIVESASIQMERNLNAKIVADGGFKKYSDVIKALALGADYVMLGSIFNKALESAGETFEGNIKYNSWTEPGAKVDQYSEKIANEFSIGRKFYKKFRGMSTKDAQKSLGKDDVKTSEGISKIHQVEYTLSGWTENFIHYLKSAMSYTDTLTLGEFIGKVDWNIISKNSFDRFNK
jgi:IMP dehydrogenase/GMP reductase